MGKFYIINQDKMVYIAHKSFSKKLKKATLFNSRKIAKEIILNKNLERCKVKRLNQIYMFIMDFFKKAANYEQY